MRKTRRNFGGILVFLTCAIIGMLLTSVETITAQAKISDIPEVEVQKIPAKMEEMDWSNFTSIYEEDLQAVKEKEKERLPKLAKKVAGMRPNEKEFEGTAYCPCEKCCGKTDGITAAQTKATAWRTVAAGGQYKLGTIIYIPEFSDEPNQGWFVVEDRGGAIGNDNLDIYFNTHEEAKQFGRRKLQVYVYQ